MPLSPLMENGHFFDSFFPYGEITSQKPIKKNEKEPSNILSADTYQTAVGVGTGLLGGILVRTSGLSSYIHEYYGHVCLGAQLTSNKVEYDVKIAAFEDFKNLSRIRSLWERVVLFFDFLLWSGRYRSGQSGLTSLQKTDPNALGKALGEQGREAWISLSGPLSELLLSTGLFVTGLAHLENRPFLASALASFGLKCWFDMLEYPWSSPISLAHSGPLPPGDYPHDFNNFAVKMSSITGMSQLSIADITAYSFTLFPFVAGYFAYFQKANEVNLSDQEVVHYMLQFTPDEHLKNDQKISTLQKNFLDVAQKYPKKEVLNKFQEDYINAVKVYFQNLKKSTRKSELETLIVCEKNYAEQLIDFDQYMLKQISSETIKQAQQQIATEFARKSKEVAKTIHKTPHDNYVDNFISASNVYCTAEIITTLVSAIIPTLQYMAYLFNLLKAFKIPLAFCHTYCVFHKKNQELEIISSDIPSYRSSALASIDRVACIFSTLFFYVLSTQPLLAPLFITSQGIYFITTYKKEKDLYQHKAIKSSIDPQQWDLRFMQLELTHHQRKNSSDYPKSLQEWIALQKDAKNAKMLSSEQIKKLQQYVDI